MRTYLRAFSPLLLVLTLGTSMSTAQVLSLDGDDGVSVGGSGDTTVTVGGDSDSNAIVDVESDGDQTDADVLPGGTGTDTEAEVRLFGNSGGGTTGTVDVTQGPTNPANAVVELFGGGSANGESSVIIELFGSGSDGVSGASGANGASGASGASGANGSNSSGGGTGGNGSVAAAGAGAAGAGAAGGGTAGAGAAGGGTAGTRLATTGNADSCFAPDQAHIANLLGRNGNSSASAISQVSDANVVSVDICPDTRNLLSQAVAADGSSSSIRTAVAANPHIVQALNSAGKSPADVLSVDSNGSNATVYVY